MEKYRGTFRVVVEFDDKGKAADFNFIKCSKENKIYRYNEDTLVYYCTGKRRVKNIIEKMKEMKKEVVKFVEYDAEGDLYFREKDIMDLKDLLKISVLGKNINPKSIRNNPLKDELRKTRDLTEEQKAVLSERLKTMRESKNK